MYAANSSRFVQIGSSLDRKVEWMRHTGQSGFLVRDDRGNWIRESTRPATGSGQYVEVTSEGEARDYRNETDPCDLSDLLFEASPQQ